MGWALAGDMYLDMYFPSTLRTTFRIMYTMIATKIAFTYLEKSEGIMGKTKVIM
jgi:hypothetical protein